MPTMNMLTGKQIRELRQRLGLNKTQFAVRLGVTETAVWKWESDIQHPRWKTMEKLNRMLEDSNGEEASAP